MKRELLLLLGLCAFAAAMIPRERRAMAQEEQAAVSTTTSKPTPNICAQSTPCGWAFYKPHFKIILMEVVNTYCVCGAGLDCQYQEDDVPNSAYVKRCRPPGTALEVEQIDDS